MNFVERVFESVSGTVMFFSGFGMIAVAFMYLLVAITK